MPQKTTIIGDGSMACVMAMLLDSKGYPVTVWGHDPETIAEIIQTRENTAYLPGYRLPDAIRFTNKPDQAFKDAELILNATPTQFIRPVWEKLAAHTPEGVGIASVSKGIETETLLRPTQIIADVLGQAQDDPDKPARPYASISGPTVAHELAKCLPATVCAASDDDAFAHSIQQAFTTHWFRVYTTPDLLGVEMAGAMKNCIALAAGILDGLQAGNNAKSALLSRGLAEITRLGTAMGANTQTFFGLTGVGDLATTCFSPTGRNRTCGEMLGRGKKLETVLEEIPGIVEGVPTAKAVMRLATKYRVEMPICEQIYKVLFENLDPLEAISKLMSRDPKPERVG